MDKFPHTKRRAYKKLRVLTLTSENKDMLKYNPVIIEAISATHSIEKLKSSVGDIFFEDAK